MHPGWDATYNDNNAYTIVAISIHASRVGCNLFLCSKRSLRIYFNSCIPGGMQLQDLDIILPYLLYLVFIYHFLIHPYLKSPFSFYFSVRILQCFYVCFIFALKFTLHLILGNVRKNVFRYSSGLFNMIFHIVFISLQIRTFCFARVIAV